MSLRRPAVKWLCCGLRRRLFAEQRSPGKSNLMIGRDGFGACVGWRFPRNVLWQEHPETRAAAARLFSESSRSVVPNRPVERPPARARERAPRETERHRKLASGAFPFPACFPRRCNRASFARGCPPAKGFCRKAGGRSRWNLTFSGRKTFLLAKAHSLPATARNNPEVARRGGFSRPA